MKGDIVTDVVEKSPKADYPIIVTFQNGILVKKTKGIKRKVEIAKDEDSQRKKVKLTYDNVEYLGEEEVNAVKTFLVVQKAASNEIKMLEVGQASMINSVLATKKDTLTVGTDYASKNCALQKMFGGKKGIRRMEKSEKFRVNATTNESSLLNTVNEMEVREDTKSVSQQLDASLKVYLPPCHRDAQNVCDVYLLPELLGQDVLDALEGITLSDLIQGGTLSSYTKELVNSKPGEKITSAVASAVPFVDSVLKFVKMKSGELKKRGQYFSEHEVIHKKIIDLFCDHDGKSLSRSLGMRDKAVAYCMALGFLIGNFVIPLDRLSEETNLSIRKLSQLCRAVGGVPKERGSQQFILKLPLPSLPSLSTSRRTSSKGAN